MASMATQNLCSSSSSSSSSTPKWNYDVFVSFRGEDTRKNFTDHLYAELERKGIRAFKDDEKLERGKEISQGLLKAIEESRISIIVLSCNYASSTWCLDELVKILDCKAANGQTVVPIFYDVDPSEVRKQTAGSFAQAFAKYEEDFQKIEQVKRWRTALTEVANLSGWDLRNTDGHEAKFIQKFVQDIWSKLNQNHTFLFVAKHLVGIHFRVEKINSLLGVVGGLDDVRIIGILGIGGIGKTTLAKAIYNQVAEHFEGSTFLADVREASRRPDGLVLLQQKLLSEILKEENLKISSVDRGVNVVKERLRSRRVLVILDDVDRKDQLEMLAGEPDWFGLGSRVIITTRDEHMLTTYKVYETYIVEPLDYNEALQLFCLNAFKEDHPPTNEFLEVSNCVVNYAGGLPLAVKVLGSFLCKKSIDEWKSALDKLQKIPNKEIHEVLKISYEGLESHEKDIFLHVACFFNGKNNDYVMKVLESCGYHPDIGVRVLTQRSLITIFDNKLRMHDLLQEMGREIVLQESPKEPGKRSRLWFDEDVCHVLTKNTGTEAIEGIVLTSLMPNEIPLSNEAFTGMHNLRLLEVSNVHPSKKFNYLPDKLRCLIWNGYPLKSMPSNFHPKNLVKLDLRYSHIKQLWETKINLENLKFFDVSHSQYLIKSPDFSGMPRLKTLTLEGCTRLVEVHPSSLVLDRLVFLNLKDCKSLRRLWKSIKFESLEIVVLSGCSKLQNFPDIQGTMERLSKVYLDGTGIKYLPLPIEHLTGLVLLNLGNCKNLARLPSSICELKSLETLTLSGCSKLGELPEDLGNMENLVDLYLDGTAIRKPPSSIVYLKNLRELSFRGCTGSSSNMWYSNFSSWFFPIKVPCLSSLLLPSLSSLSSLKRLDLSDCNLSEGAILSDIVSLSSLVDLNLSKNNFVSLPATLNQLNFLEKLRLEHCTRLQALPALPTSICEIDARGCRSLEKLSYPPQDPGLHYRRFRFGDCKILAGHEGSIFFQRQCQATQAVKNFDLFAPGSEIPEWFNEQSMGSFISWNMSPLEYSKFKGLAFCVVLTLKDAIDAEFELRCHMWDVTSGVPEKLSGVSVFHIPRNKYMESDHVWLRYTSRYDFHPTTTSDESLHFEASFVIRNRDFYNKVVPHQVKKCGVHIIYNEDDEPTMIKDKSPNLGIFHPNSDESTVKEEEENEEDIKHKRRVGEEEASGSPCPRPKRMRANTNTL